MSGEKISRPYLHLLYSPRAEGCPRLALELIEQERVQTGRVADVAFCESAPEDLLPEFRARAAAVHFLGWKRRAYMSFFFHFLRLLRDRRPRGIVCYTVGLHVPASLAARLLGIPIVLHLGNTPPADPNALRKIAIQMWAARAWVTAYAACSRVVADAAGASYALPRDRVFVVPNGIDLPSFLSLRRSRNVAAGATIEAGMVASLEVHKNHALLLRAFGCLMRDRQDFRLTLVGDGTLRQALVEQSRALGLEGIVQWAGVRRDVAAELSKLDVFVFCTTPSEGMGIAVVEALAAGLPVIASDVEGVRDVLGDGEWGILVPEVDPEKWAAAILRFREAAIPPPDALRRFAISETFRMYSRLLESKVP